ncbi:MAG: HAMP domain-containing protein, partial [Phycisphaeraceae bacterium]
MKTQRSNNNGHLSNVKQRLGQVITLMIVCLLNATPLYAEIATTSEVPTPVQAEQVQPTPAATTAVDKNAYITRLGTPGTFTPPVLQTETRPAFGPAAGTAEPIAFELKKSIDARLASLFWLITAVVALIAIALAFHLSKIKHADGKTTRGFTFGTKLTLCFGAITTVLLTVVTINTGGQLGAKERIVTISNLSNDAAIINGLQSDILMVRMNVKDFLITNSNHDLKQYSDYFAEAAEKKDYAGKSLENSPLYGDLKQVDDMMQGYKAKFEEVVTTISERNGIVTSQLNPTGARLSSLLEAITKTAAADGDPAAAIQGGKALNSLTQARVALMKYLRTSNDSDVQAALAHLQSGEDELRLLQKEIQNPIRIKWLTEAIEGYQFYAQRVNRMVALVKQRDDIVHNNLDKVGPQIAAKSQGMVKALQDQQVQIKDEMMQAQAASLLKSILMGVAGALITFFASVFMIRGITKPLAKISGQFQSIAKSLDLTQRIDDTRKDELSILTAAFNGLVGKFNETLSDVSSASSEVAAASTEIAASAEEIA